MNLVTVSTCMNRNGPLYDSAPSWPAPAVVIDWISTEPVRPEGFTVGRIDGERYFNANQARNAGARLALGEYPELTHLFFIDADVKTASPIPEFERETVYRGDGTGLFGTILMPRRVWESMRGFDERLEGYGDFETALWGRCAQFAPVKTFPAGFLAHSPHGNRLENYAEKSMGKSIAANMKIACTPWTGSMRDISMTVHRLEPV